MVKNTAEATATNQEALEKIVPSILERGFDAFVAKWVAPQVPQGITPNQITVVGFGFGILAAVGLFFLDLNRAWVWVVVVSLLLNTLADSVDGAVARQRGMKSERGFFLDHLLDQVTFTAWFMGVGLSNYALFPLAVMGAIVSNFHLILDLYWIHLRQRFPLPRIGPIEIRLTAMVLAIFTAAWPDPLTAIGGVSFGWFDMVNAVAVPLSFLECGWSAISLYQVLEGPQVEKHD